MRRHAAIVVRFVMRSSRSARILVDMQATATIKKVTSVMKHTRSAANESSGGETRSPLIDARIKELGDWRSKIFARVCALITQADSAVIEAWQWRGVLVCSHSGTSAPARRTRIT